jgi:hypothetical protein
MAANYQQIYQLMIDENAALFKEFYAAHEAYASDPKTNQAKFNEIGRKVNDVILVYEKKLCGKTESGQYSKFSRNLSEKFRDVIRKDFPKIDYVGVIMS